MEGKTHFERIIGGTEDEQKKALGILQGDFNKKHKRFAKYEIEKSPEDIDIIRKTESIVDKIVSQYGGKLKMLPLENKYILRPGSVSQMTGGNYGGGIQSPLKGKIGVERNKSNFLFASSLAHELLHLKSYKSVSIDKLDEEKGARLYRSGLRLMDTKDPNELSGEEKEYFAVLEEAIVAECTRKALNELSKEGEFKEESEAVKRIMSWVITYYRRIGGPEEQIKEFEGDIKYIVNPKAKVQMIIDYSPNEKDRQALAAHIYEVADDEGEVEPFERYEERKKFYKLLDDLITKSGGKFKNRDEIFDEFAKANFSGNYLPLARIIDGILGKGSFRKIAEDFSQKPEGMA